MNTKEARMKTLLENDFVTYYGKHVGAHHVQLSQINGTKRICDSVACNQCLKFFRYNCQHEVFVIKCASVVNIINYEKFINDCGVKGDKCDLILYDTDKIVLVELTCSMEGMLTIHFRNGIPQQGKRMKARHQLSDSIHTLCKVTPIKDAIAKLQKRETIFAYRVKDEDLFQNVPIVIEKSERVWLELARQRESQQLILPMPNDFSFQMVKYPDEYVWK